MPTIFSLLSHTTYEILAKKMTRFLHLLRLNMYLPRFWVNAIRYICCAMICFYSFFQETEIFSFSTTFLKRIGVIVLSVQYYVLIITYIYIYMYVHGIKILPILHVGITNTTSKCAYIHNKKYYWKTNYCPWKCSSEKFSLRIMHLNDFSWISLGAFYFGNIKA